MDEMATKNLDISCSTTVVQYQTVRAGGHVTMGVSAETIHRMMADTHIPVFYLINRQQFAQLKATELAPSEPEQPRRSLASLTEDEAKTVFALAFGYGPAADTVVVYLDQQAGHLTTMLEVNNGVHALQVYKNGYVIAYKPGEENERLAGFNARKVLIYLAMLGIEFEEA